ncbi:MAG: thioesterase family protein [Ilumatobacteraceae bacterium]
MSDVDAETYVREIGNGRYTTRLHAAWNIGANPNGGYALLPALRAMLDVAVHPDPLSLTVHFLRPATANCDADVTARIVRAGRTTTNVTATMTQDGTDRLVVHAVLGDLAAASPGAASGADLAPAPPDLPAPEQCVDRRELGQGVGLPILSRLDVRVRPEHVVADRSGAAVVEGWVRFTDGTPPQTHWLPLFADAFPPALRTRMGAVGWVPTIELTVHVRRRPVAGWVLARFECDDIDSGRMIESGTLWDNTGAVIARSRQLGLVLTR